MIKSAHHLRQDIYSEQVRVFHRVSVPSWSTGQHGRPCQDAPRDCCNANFTTGPEAGSRGEKEGYTDYDSLTVAQHLHPLHPPLSETHGPHRQDGNAAQGHIRNQAS